MHGKQLPLYPKEANSSETEKPIIIAACRALLFRFCYLSFLVQVLHISEVKFDYMGNARNLKKSKVSIV